jgi:hypothetical protein
MLSDHPKRSRITHSAIADSGGARFGASQKSVWASLQLNRAKTSCKYPALFYWEHQTSLTSTAKLLGIYAGKQPGRPFAGYQGEKK